MTTTFRAQEAKQIYELKFSLGQLLSCFSIPAAPDKHEVNLARPVEEVEQIYLDALKVMTL